VLPLYVEQAGVTHARVPLVAGTLFSVMAFTGALGHHFCGKLLRHYASRVVIAGGATVAALGCGLYGLSGNFWIMSVASVLLGLGIGAAMTASYSAAGAVIPPDAHGAGFGVLTSAALVGMATSPLIAGFVGGASLRIVFFIDFAMMALLAAVVQRTMTESVPSL
jgi:MFS family permease